jgi:hypothetical protein
MTTAPFPDRFACGRIKSGVSQSVLAPSSKNRGAYRRVKWLTICNPTASGGQITIRLARKNATSVILTTVDLEREQTFYWKDMDFILGPSVTGLVLEPVGFLAHYSLLYQDEIPYGDQQRADNRGFGVGA